MVFENISVLDDYCFAILNIQNYNPSTITNFFKEIYGTEIVVYE